MLRSFKLALDKGLVDYNLGGDIREFTSLPRFYLLPHGFEVALHPVDPDRDAINQRKRFRVLGKHRRKVPRESHIRAHEHAITAGHRETHALVMGVSYSD